MEISFDLEMRCAAVELVKKKPRVSVEGVRKHSSRLSKEKKETGIMRIRCKKRLKHDEAARTEKNQDVRKTRSGDDNCFCRNKMKFLVFLAMINCCRGREKITEKRNSC